MSEFLNSAGTKYLLEKIKDNYLSTADTSTITSLIGVDTTPTDNSDNLITSGGVKGALDGKANSAHTHGFITSEGTITTNMAIANGDRLVFSDSSIGNQLVRHSLTFNGSTTTKALTQKGTFENVVNTVNGQSGAVTITIPGDITNAEIDAIWNNVMTGEFTLVTGLSSSSDINSYLVQYLNAFDYVTPNIGNGQYDTGLIYIPNNNITWYGYNAPSSPYWNDNIVGHDLKMSSNRSAYYDDGTETELIFVYDATTGKIYASDTWEEEEEEEEE